VIGVISLELIVSSFRNTIEWFYYFHDRTFRDVKLNRKLVRGYDKKVSV
jgi:hypothetical protein